MKKEQSEISQKESQFSVQKYQKEHPSNAKVQPLISSLNSTKSTPTQNSFSDASIKVNPQLLPIHNSLNRNNIINNSKRLYAYLQDLDEDKLKILINTEICVDLKSQIGVGINELEKEFIKIVNLIAERGSYHSKFNQPNLFFFVFFCSRLLANLEEIFMNREENMNNLNKLNQIVKYSQYTILQAQTIAFINKHQDTYINKIELYGKPLSYQIIQLIELIKQQQKKKKFTENLQIELKNGINSLVALRNLVQNSSNFDYLANTLRIHESFSALIHINCSQTLNCQQCLIIPEISISLELQGALYLLYCHLPQEDNIKQYLLQQHYLLEHLTSNILFIASAQPEKNKIQLQHNKYSQSQQIQQTQDQQNLVIPYTYIIGTVELLIFLLNNDHSLLLQAFQIPNFEESLIQFAKYDRMQNQYNILKDADNQLIRNGINKIIFKYIQTSDNQMFQKIIIEKKLIQHQIEILGNGQVNQETNNETIINSINNIKSIYQKLHIGCDSQINSIKSLEKCVDVQIEEQGGLEECQAHIFSIGEQNGNLSQIASILLIEVLNIFNS